MIFNRHILRTEHWSTIASELFVSRRQFFRERRLLCDKLCLLLEAGSQSVSNTTLVQPAPEDLVYNDAALAYQSGHPNVADRILAELSVLASSGELRAKALTLAAECAYDGLLFDVVLARCALAERAAAEIADFETRALASARVSLTRTRYFLGQADYDRARLEMEGALHKLSELSPPSDHRRSDLMQAILARQAEIAIHMGDFRGALERIHRAKYALGGNGEASEATFDLASIEALMDTFAGRHQSALTTLTEAASLAQRLGFNRQIVKLAVERAWYEFMVDRTCGRALAKQLAGLADAVRIPELKLDATLFCAANESPVQALEDGAKALAMAPRDSLWAARAILSQADACFRLGRIADAWSLAVEGERLAGRLGNHRVHAWSLVLMARIKLKCGDKKLAMALKSNAEQLVRFYASAPERSRFEEFTDAASAV